ncbi:hypothetical protein B0A53_03007 [Rhodotorula sp. CCFEE 5036]|nr:hypothetical protein B0A53_03007 [Rhodotorula sp. CCFEE 5036]
MLCAAHSVLAGEGMSITAPTKIKPESRVTISWSGGKATFTVRILVNSHEFSELKSIADTWYTWTAQGVKDGDQVQFYVYDSAGASTKSPHIPVRVKADSSSDNTSSKSGESRTKQSVTSEAAETYSDSKATVAGDGGNEVVVKSTETTTTSTATGTRSGRIPTAPPQSSYAPESTTTPSSESATSSSSSSNVLTTDAPAPEATSAPTTPPTAPSAADPATPPSTSTTTSTSPDRTNLYLGLIGILIALVLLLVLVCAARECGTRKD